jgi:TolB-like protein
MTELFHRRTFYHDFICCVLVSVACVFQPSTALSILAGESEVNPVDIREQQQQQPSTRVVYGVLDFREMSQTTLDQARSITDELRAILARQPGVVVIDRAQIEAILEEQHLSASGLCDDKECQVAIGKIISANKMIRGNIVVEEGEFTIQAQIIDVATSQMGNSGRETVKQTFTLSKAYESLPSLIRQLLGREQAAPVEQARAPDPTAVRLVLQSDPVSVVFLNGSRQGITPLKLSPPPGRHEIVFESANAAYRSETRQVQIVAGYNDTISVRLMPIPAQYTIITDLEGVTIFLDGSVQGTTPKTVQLYQGSHEIRLERPGYQTVTRKIEAFPNSGGTIAIQMTPLPARLSVTTRPNGAKIWIDGEEMGTTPGEISLNPGTHNVVISMLDYDSIRETITLGNGALKNIGGTLSSLRTHKVYLETDPRGAMVVVDGTEKGKTPLPLFLTARSHELEFRLSGYDTIKRSYVPSAAQNRISEKLLESGRGTIVLRPFHRGAKVKVSHDRTVDRFYQTPTDTIRVRPGESRIKVAAKGYSTWRWEGRLRDGEAVSLNVDLNPKSRVGAGILSVFIPGLGQMYSGHGGRGMLLLLAHAGLGVYGYGQYREYADARHNYELATEDYRRAIGDIEIAAAQTIMEERWVTMQDARDPFKTTVIALSAVYLINVLDSIIFMPRLPKIRPTVQSGPYLNAYSGNGNLGITLSFRF